MSRKYPEKQRRRTHVMHPDRRAVDHVNRADDMGPCPYCGSMYSQRNAGVHFIPCCYCDSLEHAGCRH